MFKPVKIKVYPTEKEVVLYTPEQLLKMSKIKPPTLEELEKKELERRMRESKLLQKQRESAREATKEVAEEVAKTPEGKKTEELEEKCEFIYNIEVVAQKGLNKMTGEGILNHYYKNMVLQWKLENTDVDCAKVINVSKRELRLNRLKENIKKLLGKKKTNTERRRAALIMEKYNESLANTSFLNSLSEKEKEIWLLMGKNLGII